MTAAPPDPDHAALVAACEPGVALCTLVGIEGSFSRRLGAQLAVRADGTLAGSLSDGCLEAQLARDARVARGPEVHRYGRGSPNIDFRLPCGGGLDILVDPAPDRAAVRDALAALKKRRPATLPLPANPLLVERPFVPTLRITAFGEGPELAALEAIGAAAEIRVEAIDRAALSLGRPSGRDAADAWTAIVLLFHDHEWEIALLEEALAGDAFIIGAQGGAQAREARLAALRRRGISEAALARLRSPIGTPAGSRTPSALALAILAEVVGTYEARHPLA